MHGNPLPLPVELKWHCLSEHTHTCDAIAWQGAQLPVTAGQASINNSLNRTSIETQQA